jgi:diguanylate cyclase (GGDEF)-like protein
MDYGTYFFANIATVIVFTVSMSLLAWYNRRVVGVAWFAGGLIVGLVKLILQGLEGKVSPILCNMTANELYLISFVMQMMGLHWFVARRPMRRQWPFYALGLVLVVYSTMFLLKIPYSGNVVNLPFVGICGASIWILLKYGRRPFAMVSRVSAIALFAEMAVAGYRAVLTNLKYMRPWETVHAETDPRWMNSLATMSFLATIMVMCYLWFLVTELEWELAELARTDPLTGTLNRRALEEVALRETARSMRHGHPLCMVMLDLDDFKHMNDTRGHAAGDRALQAFVRQVRTMLRRQDLLARTGGDEFTVLMPDTPASAGIVTAERIRLAIAALEIPYETGPIKFTVSAGVSQLDLAYGGWEGMTRRADAAMYEAKEHGRNSVAVESPSAVN